MKKVINLIYSILPVLLFTAVMTGCEKSDNEPSTKGARSVMMQNIAANVEYIQSIESETTYNLCEGIEITDLSCTYMRTPTRMIIAVIDLSKNITVAASSPDNKTSGITGLQTIPEQAMSAENAGSKVWLAINGGEFNSTEAKGLFYKDGVAIKETAEKGYDNCVVVTRDGKVRICSVSEFLVLKKQAVHTIGGKQRLMEDGNIGAFMADDNTMAQQARTFVGTNMDASKFYIFVVEGSAPEYSTGIRLRDAMLICQGAGCYQAMNLSDGIYTTLAIREETASGVVFNTLNRLSQTAPQKALNGLMITEKQ